MFDQLDSIVRASSLVEMVNSLLRPYLNSCKGQITQESLNLIMFYHNHRRYKSGKRKGKAPIELLTGKPLEADWIELLMHEGEGGPDATLEASLGSRPLLELVPCSPGGRVPSAAPPGQARFALTTDSENSQRHMDAEAA